MIDTLAPLRLNGLIQHDANIGNGIRASTLRSTRDEWYRGPGAMPQSVIDEMQRNLRVGAWNFTIRFYGYDEINQANATRLRQAIAKHTDAEFTVTQWHRGEPLTRTLARACRA